MTLKYSLTENHLTERSVKVVTQHTGSGSLPKTPKVFTYPKKLTGGNQQVCLRTISMQAYGQSVYRHTNNQYADILPGRTIAYIFRLEASGRQRDKKRIKRKVTF